jgi:hypothetical protein
LTYPEISGYTTVAYSNIREKTAAIHLSGTFWERYTIGVAKVGPRVLNTGAFRTYLNSENPLAKSDFLSQENDTGATLPSPFSPAQIPL